MSFWYKVRSVTMLAGLVGGIAACSGNGSNPVGSPLSPDADADTFFLSNDLVSAQSMPNAVFRTVPPADADEAIRGNGPLQVEFNNCQSRPTDDGDDLKFTYDFDDDGNVDEFGHCRWSHTYTRPATARVCVSDRRGSEACRSWEIRPGSMTPPDSGPAPIIGGRPSATWRSISINCGPKTNTVVMQLTDPDNDSMTWSVALTGGTLTSGASGGPVASGSTVTVAFTGTAGLSTLRMDLVDSKGLASVPATRFGPANTCGGQILHILG
jgi:hypothetical protein